MATNSDSETLADQIAMGLGGGLVILGVVVLGLVEVLAGAPYSPMTREGTVAAGVAVDPYWRALLVTLGMAVLMLYAIYVFATRQHLSK